MTGKQYIILASLGSVMLMLGALAFQHIGGMAPCKLCIWQRYPHVIAILLGVLALALNNTLRRGMICGAILSTASTAGIGLYHAGVEKGVFEGPTSCTSSSIQGLDTDDLFNQIMVAPLVRCDDIPWQLAGLSMAGWNAVISLVLCCIWIMALRRSRA